MPSRTAKMMILKHLSKGPDTWASTVSKVSEEFGSRLFVEDAMKSLVEDGEVESQEKPGAMPTYQAPGAGEGKYAGFNDKRLFEPKPLGTDEAV